MFKTLVEFDDILSPINYELAMYELYKSRNNRLALNVVQNYNK